MYKRGKIVYNSNCNGIEIASDRRIRNRLQNEWTMNHPVPSQDDVGKYIVVNVGALGRNIPELGYYESWDESHRLKASIGTVRYSGIIVGITQQLIIIDRYCRVANKELYPHQQYQRITQEYNGVRYITRQCAEPLSSFRSGYARYVLTSELYVKHLLMQSGGGKKLQLPSRCLISLEMIFKNCVSRYKLTKRIGFHPVLFC